MLLKLSLKQGVKLWITLQWYSTAVVTLNLY